MVDAPRGWAHPRVCGENVDTRNWEAWLKGSSPRVRGKPKRNVLCAFPHRLIPACAGKTYSCYPLSDSRTAHPRVCGENKNRSVMSRHGGGSSPRVRGKLIEALGGQVIRRLIPACAGKTESLSKTLGAPPAHPRVCGENVVFSFLGSPPTGSSPRVRGKLVGIVKGAINGRLIPACAGKTRSRFHRIRRCRAHPRVCGENCVASHWPPASSGSSPRVRGKRQAIDRSPANIRLIPACAGKTVRSRLIVDSRPAHPRVCGENIPYRAFRPLDQGSSPRVRGKPSPSL